ncbi:MAG: thioredoxin family protein [Rikenellaceae bacterium]|nr:thioredoxin family protein [Rikenellaceae bacterium]
MKKFIALLMPLLFGLVAMAQPAPTPVKWTATAVEADATTYEVRLTADIDQGWHIYDFGPYAEDLFIATTEISIDGAEKVGEINASKAPHREYDDVYEAEIGTWEGKVVFTQKVKAEAEPKTVAIEVYYGACNDQNCLPPATEQLSVKIGAAKDAEAAVAPEEAATEEIVAEEVAPAEEIATATDAVVEPIEEQSNGSLWSTLLAAAAWALAALLTPCVFPMIPMTVSFFVKGGEGGKMRALLYGVFIVALYTLPIAALILITRVVGGATVTADIFNWLATHWLPNTIFFLVFMVFAASFFGAFEITLPNSWVNKSDQNSDRKGLLGVFFLALTLVLVSFSCTGPIVGGAIIGAVSTNNDIWTPILTMLVFSTVFALPFVLFALFPSVLQKMPKSGGWLNSVKVVLGFIEVALGFKFLSTADQTYHWGLLDREIYLGIWIVVFTLLGFYLLGKLKFAHDSEVKYISVPRLALAIASFTFVTYMVPGLWGAPLKKMTGYLPPMATQDFVLTSGGTAAVVAADELLTADGKTPKYSDVFHMPHGLSGFYDFDEAIEAARKAGKPLFLDFTGLGCVNCREMEERVWCDSRIQDRMREDFVLLALFGGSRQKAAEEDWVTTENGKTLKTIGEINSNLVFERYNIAAQPNYLILDGEGNVLASHSYDLDIENFISFLDKGKEAYSALK